MRLTLRSTGRALAIASCLALLEMLRTTLTRMVEGNPISTFDLLHRVVPNWVTVVIASPWCVVMAERHPFRAGRTGSTLTAHLGGGAVFVALRMLLLMTYHSIDGGIHFMPQPFLLLHSYLFYIAMELSIYAEIVIVLMLLDARREAAERDVAAARLSRNLAAARLQSLQAQIRPHFLFNTLNALAVLARRGDGAAVDRAIGDLGELLRASFDAPDRHVIPLREELEFLERYVSLQRIRFPDRLEVDWAIEEGAGVALVPALLVQPLVENALEHGLATTRGGRVRVAARRAGETLEIEVSDDGPGFGAAGAPGSEGVGLANTRERLALLYGAGGTLECGDRPGGGGLVRIRLPWRRAGAPGAPA